ncbi:MAG: hypothetical protein HUU16_22280, partial [Candidatus Omnitrophica bacterium]|nr:hypothetical protein [Candidatus Omnitrophota bacterium]
MDRLEGFDFARHNAEVRALWDAWNAGKPTRVPVIFGFNSRYFMNNPETNPQGLDFRAYSEDPDLMFDTLLGFVRWRQFNILMDAELGLPEKWELWVDFQNYHEAAWLGCPIEYRDGQVPDTSPLFKDRPEKVMENGIPDPMGGLLARGLEYYEHFKERASREEFLGRPIAIPPPFTGSDGVMTVACNLFGPEFVCTEMARDPDRIRVLFGFINDCTVARMRAWRALTGVPVPQDGFWYADDSIALISTRMYREHVLPHHRRVYAEFGTEKGRFIHLCGNATRHFKTIQEELGMEGFDTGYPVDFGRLRRELGPRARIWGGPRVELLRAGTESEVVEETRRILRSGILDQGGLFVLREGNNLAPGTPHANLEAMYRTGIEEGRALSRPVEEGRALSRPVEEGRALSRPVEEGRALSRPVEEGRALSRPVEEGRALSRPVEEG